MQVSQASSREATKLPSSPGGTLFLVSLSLLCAAAVVGASIRHTGSIAFPIDDGYIYSNYVLSAAHGQPFVYNSGESSGGITSIAWYILCTLSYWFLEPFSALFGHVIAGKPASLEATHLYLAAYLPGVLSLTATALGVRRLTLICLQGVAPLLTGTLPIALSLLAGSVAAADLGLVWGSLSGLESTFAAALAVWAVCLLVQDVSRGAPRWSLLAIGLLPWARPDLLALLFACLVWLTQSALLSRDAERRALFTYILLYFVASAVGMAILSGIYLAGWGRPLPSSFYAKVGGLRLGGRFFSAVQELLAAGRYLPFVAAGTAVVGGLLSSFRPGVGSRPSVGVLRLTPLLLLLVSLFYTLGILLTLPWFGQEDRYLLPVHPFVIVLLALLLYRLIPVQRVELLRRVSPLLVGIVLLIALPLSNYLVSTRDYVVEVRNIADAHIKPALWLAANTPASAIVASEPIGAVKLFSDRLTVDLVGLTTPATLGTYRDWPRAWPALRKLGVTYLLYYPNWFDERRPPAWATERAHFDIHDNRIAGDNVIAIYELHWDRYLQP
ncbi:MAG: hypothetical protein M3014_09550 [Chloroflexota bacterium]|nr:hypothetical protein [Chloroflexota bacterium]